jgi:hypothetical protein
MARRNPNFEITASLKGLDSVVTGFDRMAPAGDRATKRINQSARDRLRDWDRLGATISKVTSRMDRLDRLHSAGFMAGRGLAQGR